MEAPVRHPRAVAVSTVIVLLVAALAGFAVLRAFQFLGGSLSAAGFGVWLFLALSFVSLLAGLFAVFDLVYLLGTGYHLLFRPLRPGSGQVLGQRCFGVPSVHRCFAAHRIAIAEQLVRGASLDFQ